MLPPPPPVPARSPSRDPRLAARSTRVKPEPQDARLPPARMYIYSHFKTLRFHFVSFNNGIIDRFVSFLALDRANFFKVVIGDHDVEVEHRTDQRESEVHRRIRGPLPVEISEAYMIENG